MSMVEGFSLEHSRRGRLFFGSLKLVTADVRCKNSDLAYCIHVIKSLRYQNLLVGEAAIAKYFRFLEKRIGKE